MWLWLCVIAFGGIWGVLQYEMSGGKGKGGGKGGGGGHGKFKRWINFALFTLWTMSLLLAPMGSWGNLAAIMARGFGAIFGWICGNWMPGVSASDLAFVLSLPVIVGILIDLWGRRPDRFARFGLILLVPLCLLAGGVLGNAVIDLTTSLTGTSAEVLQNLASS